MDRFSILWIVFCIKYDMAFLTLSRRRFFYGMELQFKQQMQGSVEIITEDIRLMERIIRPLRYILKKNTNL